jgi:hypothetical protein
MSEKCPLSDPDLKEKYFHDQSIPAICLAQCADIWQSVELGEEVEDGDCGPKCEFALTESSGESLSATSSIDRKFIAYDQCEECQGPAGYMIYLFRCPFAETIN